MNARVRQVFTVRIMSIVGIGGFTALVVANLVIVIAAPTTHALSLNGLAQSLTKTFQPVTGSSHNSGSTAASSPATSTTNVAATPAVITSDAPLNTPPIEVTIQPINAMKPLVEPAAAAHTQASFNPTIAQIAFRVTGLGSAITDDPAPIQPTGQGWRIFGILWYWWALLVAVIAVPSVIFKRFLSNFFLGLGQIKGLFAKI